jgi:hypothetical protein
MLCTMGLSSTISSRLMRRMCGGVAGARLHALTVLCMQQMLNASAKNSHMHSTLMVACCEKCPFGWLMAKETIILVLMGMRMQGWWN